MPCFRICVLFIAYVSACDLCPFHNGFASVCTKEIVCPTNTHVVIVKCYVQKIISNERIGQLLIQGPCNTIELYIHFFFDNNIWEIEVAESKQDPLLCSSNFLISFICMHVSMHPSPAIAYLRGKTQLEAISTNHNL